MEVVRNAIRGCAAYPLNWSDAHLGHMSSIMVWLKCESKTSHDRLYGNVRVVNPFLEPH